MQLTGKLFLEMTISAANLLEARKEEINNLNVFPVPDGDTGVNMSMTIGGARQVLLPADATLSEAAEQVANRVLRSARGNSGAILSLFFRGFSKAVRGLECADSEEIAMAFARGRSEAYKAVMNPTEGTILTVIRVCAERADTLWEQYTGNPAGLFDELVRVAKEALAKTPEMLPILKQAKVVDAGGCGFVAVLEGMGAALHGNPVAAVTSDTAVKSAADFGEFHTEDIKYGYCTECIVEKSLAYRGEGKVSAFYRFITQIGDSAVFVDDDEIIKLHVHTNHPGKVLENALKYGSLATVKIENMRLQHSELAGGVEAEHHHDAAQKESGESAGTSVNQPADGAVNDTAAREAESAKRTVKQPEKPYGFVTVCAGDGIRDVFADLGADQIVTGGQTMNPSTEDILDAILATPAENVFVFPNNKNIQMVAEQAAKLTNDREVFVIPTRSVPEAISAMLNFDESADAATNADTMREVIGGVTVLTTTYAVRDTEIGEVAIRKDDVLGMCNGKILVSVPGLVDCVKALIGECREKVAASTFISVFWGEGADEDTAAEVTGLLQALAPDAEINTIHGGQPVYSFLISLE